MKNNIILAILIIAVNLVKGQGIHFEDKLNWEQVKAKAKSENKAIFIDIYTTWCGPCKWMEENVYGQQEVGDYINKNFISIKVQMDSTAKDNDQIRSWYGTAKKMFIDFKVAAYPTLLFLNGDGAPSFKVDAILKPENFIKAATLSLDTNSGYLGKVKQYQSGKNESAFVLDLIRHGRELGQEAQALQIANQYIASIKEDELFTKDNLWILYENTRKSTDRGFRIFLNRADKVEQIDPLLAKPYSENLVNNIIREELIVPFLTGLGEKPDWAKIKANLKIWGKRGEQLLAKEEYRSAAMQSFSRFDKDVKPLIAKSANWEDVIAKIESLKVGKGEEILVGTTIIVYMNRTVTGKEMAFDKFFKAATYYERNFPTVLHSMGLNDWAWFSFNQTNDINKLKKAVEWSEKGLSLDPGQINLMDTHANLLYKLGNVDDAIKWEQKALDRDPNNTEFQQTLEKMKKGEPTWQVAVK